MVFSTDDEVLNLFEESGWALAAMMVTMTLSVNLERIPLAMGRSKLVLGLGLVGSWVGQVPAVVLCLRFWRRDLVGLYTGVALGYALLDILLLGVIATCDWNKFAKEAQARSEMGTPKTPAIPDADSDADPDAEGSQEDKPKRGTVDV
mmetsp:Transcript_74317/g.174458  ORF Transcript_74317/g.174458 Transcript_74317/m.174458 type:complete len:148 (+) Transcript_74317:99-542(+)